MQILLNLTLTDSKQCKKNISANRKVDGDRKNITHRFAGGEKPFGKTPPLLQNLHNVLSSTQDYNTLAMQVQLRQ